MAKGTITVVGLGSGDKDDLTFETWDLLKGANRLFLRTEDHPVVSWLKRRGLTYRTFDDVYERYDRFQPVYEEVVETLFREAAKGAVVYAVPGHPMVAEKTTQLLLDRGPSRGIRVDVKGGRSFLEALFGRLRLDPIDGFLLLDGSSLVVDQLNPRLNTVIAQVYDLFTASDVKLTLMERYPDDWEVVVVHALGITGKEAITPMPLYALDRSFPVSSHSLVVVPPVPEEVALKGDFTDFVRIVSALRGPDGCPWGIRHRRTKACVRAWWKRRRNLSRPLTGKTLTACVKNWATSCCKSCSTRKLRLSQVRFPSATPFEGLPIKWFAAILTYLPERKQKVLPTSKKSGRK